MKLKALVEVTPKNRYCGPAVLSFVTGMDTGESAALLRHVSGRRAITGIAAPHLLSALSQCGYATVRIAENLNLKKAPTLAAWLRDSKDVRTAGRVFLILAGYHYFLVTGRKYACGIVRDIVSIRDPRIKRRARVAAVWEILERVEGPDRSPVTAARTKAVREQLAESRNRRARASRARSTLRNSVLDHAERLGLRIEVDEETGDCVHLFIRFPEWMTDLIDGGEVYMSSFAHSWEEADATLAEFENLVKARAAADITC